MYQAAEEAAAAGPRGRKRNAADAVVPAPGGHAAVVDLTSPIVAAKAVKNAAELEGMRQAHLRDAVAICDFLNWLEKKVRSVIPCVSMQSIACRKGTCSKAAAHCVDLVSVYLPVQHRVY